MQRVYGLLRFVTAVLFLLCFVPSALTAATVDVMIVYDSTAKSWVDSNGGMNAFAADAVARMNQATANSNVDLTFRLAHAAVVSYTYSGDLGTDLTNLRAGTGNLSVVGEWRDTYGADLVALLVDTGSAYGTVGIGYMLSTYSGSPAYAFTTSAIRSVNLSHTLTHEVGHNLGCHHSKYQTSSPGPNTALNSYSAGWYFTGTNTTKYHTIMAYDSDGHGNYYTEAPLFSTPLLSYQGTVAGSAADGDNARNIRQTMDVVAAYRSAPSISLSPNSASFSSPAGAGSITVTVSNSFSWTATSNASWIIITSGANGTGSGIITYIVTANATGSTRTGTITIEGITFTVTQAANSFTDVPQGYWAYDYIMAIYSAGYTAGYGSASIFAPDLPVTREQMAAFIVRAAEGEPATDYCSSGVPFADVIVSDWACKYIKRLYELDLTTGYGATGLYMPSLNITRAQMAAFIVRAAEGEPATDYCSSGVPFADVIVSDWACKYIKRLYELGITTGYGDGRYGPDDLVTRAQMAVFLGRAFQGME